MSEEELDRELASWMAEAAPRDVPAVLHEPAHELARRRPTVRARSGTRALPGMALAAVAIVATLFAVRGLVVTAPGTASTRPSTNAASPGLVESTAPPTPPARAPQSDWTSVTWSLTDPEPFTGPGNQFIQDVAPVDRGFVAAGYETGATPTAIVWTEAPGGPWIRVSDHSATFADSIIDRLVAVPGGLIAIGRPGSPDGAHGVRLWRSPDGQAWTRLPLDETLFGDWYDPGLQIASGPGGLIAAGWDRNTGATRIWNSEDGSGWTADPVASASFDGASLWIVGTPTGYVATGSRSLGPASDTGLGPDHVGVAFRSADGRTWSPATVDGAHGLGRVFVARDGLLAPGSNRGPTNAIVLPDYWQSPDGTHWEHVENRGTAAARFGTQIAADGDRIYALSPFGSEWSTDGITWHPLDEFVTDMEPRSRPWWAMNQAAAGPGGIVANGETTVGRSGDAGDQTDGLIWMAVPGRTPTSAPMPTPEPEHDQPCQSPFKNPDGTCG